MDGIVAKVNGEPVFLRELKTEYWLAPGEDDASTAGRNRPSPPGRGGEGPGLKTRVWMDRLLDRKLLAQEAERLKMGSEDPAEKAREIERKTREIMARAGGGKGGVSRADIERWVAQDLAIRVLKEKRIGLLVVVSDAEVESYHAGHEVEFAGASLDAVRARIANRIYRKKFDEQYDRWFSSLKLRSQIEVFLDEEPWKSFDFAAYFQSAP